MRSMVNETTVSETELAERLTDVLDRVNGGERLTVERDGKVMAILIPPEPKPQFTYGDFIALMNRLPRPDDRFADDLEAIQRSQPMILPIQWSD
jgi:antitoxin (DNA-binding transcriptional repressor) of toxin-antitoxin stability system